MKPKERSEETKRRVHRAFLCLLQEKDIHRITIRELCEGAGINRTTFYNHYGSQYDVLAEMGDRYLGQIARAIEHADLNDRQSVHSRVTLVLEYILENRELSAMLINYNVDPTFASRLFSLPKIGQMLSQALAGIPNEKERSAAFAFAIWGSYKVLQDWINDPERCSPEEETELILGLAGRACRWRK